MKDTERQCSINTCREIGEKETMTPFLWGSCEKKDSYYYLCSRCVKAFDLFVKNRFDPPFIEPAQDIKTAGLIPDFAVIQQAIAELNLLNNTSATSGLVTSINIPQDSFASTAIIDVGRSLDYMEFS